MIWSNNWGTWSASACFRGQGLSCAFFVPQLVFACDYFTVHLSIFTYFDVYVYGTRANLISVAWMFILARHCALCPKVMILLSNEHYPDDATLYSGGWCDMHLADSSYPLHI